MQQIHTQAYECWIFVSLICCAARAKEVEWNGGLSASALRTESSLAIKGLTKRGRRYQGWSRLRRSPRKWWCGKVTKWQGQSTKKWRLCCRWSRFRQVEDHTAKNRKQTNARWVLLNRKRRKSLSFDEIAGVVERGRGRTWPHQWCLPTGSVLSGRRRSSCGLTPWAKVGASAIFYHGYTERRFAFLFFFSVNSHNSHYPEIQFFFYFNNNRRGLLRRAHSINLWYAHGPLLLFSCWSSLCFSHQRSLCVFRIADYWKTLFAVEVNRLSGSPKRLDILPAFCFSLTVVISQEKKIDRKIDREVKRQPARQKEGH